jgi:hypothetical protein
LTQIKYYHLIPSHTCNKTSALVFISEIVIFLGMLMSARTLH